MKHLFTLYTKWDEGRNGVGSLQADRLQTAISIPPEMDGPGIGTNPDEMLLGASATCYLITLAAMLERVHIQAKLAIRSTATVDVTNGVYTYERIEHEVTMLLDVLHDKHEKLARRLAEKAEGTCMISKALKGNVDIMTTIHIKGMDE